MGSPHLSHTTILGVRVHDVTLNEALDLIGQFAAAGGPHQIATVNSEFVMAAQDNAAFRDVLNRAALCVPDGIGLVWASRRQAREPGSVRLRERVAGVELTEQIASRAAREGWRVFLLGAAPGVAEKAARILQERYPGLDVAGTYSGSPSIEEQDAIAAMIRGARADVLFVAYGAPAQDLWIARNLDRLNVSVAVGVGGAFDFISGVAQRAPRWVQRVGLEWLHRLIRQPWRIKRQLALPRFAAQVIRHSLPSPLFYLPLVLFAGVLGLYISTLAPGAVPGDPSEYTFVPRVLGIAHPPGYAFYTVLAWLWQNVVQVGTLAYRTNLLAAAAGATISGLVYAIIFNTQYPVPNSQSSSPPPTLQSQLPALFGALSAAVAVDIWQHSLHANAHIISALLAALMLFLLVRWYASGNERWLYSFALVAGLGVTQHPLLIFGFPACAVFILLTRPRLLTQWRKWLALLVCFAAGLSVWLYIPLRGPSSPFNRMDASLEAFWHHATAQGLRVNLFAFGPSDQPVRLNVFWQLMRLQYPLITLALAGVGALWLARKRPKLFALFALFFATYVFFVINTIQDVMAYLMLPFIAVAVMAGAGVKAISSLLSGHTKEYYVKLGALALILLPLCSAWHTAPRVSLREYHAGQEWVEAVFAHFKGKGEQATLLAPWELMTPLWVAAAEGRALDPADVTPVHVAPTSANPYLDNVFTYWDRTPVYLADFRREVWEGDLFRLRPTTTDPQPTTSLWQVVAPGDKTIPPLSNRLNVMAEDQAELVGYELDARSLRPGQTAHLIVAMRAPVAPTHYLVPFALLGERAYRWTTDSHVRSIAWQPGEVIVEQYDITIPFGAPPGRYLLRLGVADLSAGRDLGLDTGATTVDIGEIIVEPARGVVPPQTVLDSAAANFDSRVALMGARACARQCLDLSDFHDQAGLEVRAGQSIEVWLDWRVLQRTEESYKAFVHLITAGNQLVAQGDYYTPMGGAFPSSLWIPRWIEGQTFSDPYWLVVPPDLPPGEYAIEIGLYGLTSLRRAPIFDHAGSLAGDRVILGAVQVSGP